MLRIHTVNPTGFFSYGVSGDINLPDGGMIHLLGCNEDKGDSSNGAGKTSLFNATAEILYGANPTGVSGDGVANTVLGKGCCGRVVFSSHEGFYYRVTYCRNWKDDLFPADSDNQEPYRGTALFFEKWVTDQWVDCRGASIRDTRTLIVNALGLDYQRFLDVAYVSPRSGVSFLSGSNKEREDILATITGVLAWDEVRSSCRGKLRAFEEEIILTQQHLARKEGELETLQAAQARFQPNYDWQQYLNDLQKSLADRQAAMAQIQTERDTLNTKLERFNKDLVEAQKSDVSVDLTDEINEVERKIAAARTVSAVGLGVRLEKTPTRRQEVEAELNRCHGEIKALGGTELFEAEYCPLCHSKIAQNRKKKLLAELDALKERVIALEDEQVKLVADEAAEAENRRREQADLQRKRDEQLQDLMQELSDLKARQGSVSDNVVVMQRKIIEVSQKIQAVDHSLNSLSRKNADDTTNISRATDTIEHLKVYREKILAVCEEIEEGKTCEGEIQRESAVYEWLYRHIPYIKLHKLSASAVVLSDAVNAYLSSVGSSLRVEIASFSEKKSKKGAADIADTLKSEIKVKVIDGVKDLDYRLYSEGERATLAIAITKGLHDLAVGHGQGCNLKLYDEVFSFLDHMNSQRLAESFEHERDGLMLLTDNSGRASGLLNFDYTWVARKRGGITRLEVFS